MTDPSVGTPPQIPHRLTPERVRSIRFGRTPIGRRGLNEDEVAQFQERVAAELAERDAAEAALRAKIEHYKRSLIQWQREHSGDPYGEQATGGQVATRPTVEAVNILSRAQQEADAYIAQTQQYCRQLADEAQAHAEQLLAEARTQAEQLLAEPMRLAKDAASANITDLADLERRLTWARSFIASLEAVEAQLRTAREALAYEFDRARVPEADRRAG